MLNYLLSFWSRLCLLLLESAMPVIIPRPRLLRHHLLLIVALRAWLQSASGAITGCANRFAETTNIAAGMDSVCATTAGL